MLVKPSGVIIFPLPDCCMHPTDTSAPTQFSVINRNTLLVVESDIDDPLWYRSPNLSLVSLLTSVCYLCTLLCKSQFCNVKDRDR
jgi:hypothetical protein